MTSEATSGDGAGTELAGRILGLLRDVPDHPTPGILFKDITPLLADPGALAAVVRAMAAAPAPDGVDAVVAIEARGFIFGAPVALELGVPFVPVRKQGKLPWATVGAEYDLEYASAAVEVHADALTAGQRVLVIDDILATGGTLAATCDLVERLGASVAGIGVLLELTGLQGRSRLSGRPVHALAGA